MIVNGRTPERVHTAVEKLRGIDAPGALHAVPADLSSGEATTEVVAKHPAVDILVNNLGIFEPKPFEQIGDEDWRRFFEVNVLSGVRLSRHYFPRMREKNWGRILFVSSESGIQIPAEMIHYGVTKTAQLAVSRGLAETTTGTGITVNSILPGPTASEGVVSFVDRLASDSGTDRAAFEKEFFHTMRPTSLLQRFERPEEIAALAVFLSSPLASAINGAALRVDGGVVRSIV